MDSLTTKKELTKTIAEAVGLSVAAATEIAQRVLDWIIDTLVEEGRIELRNFGVFEVVKRKARRARNPKTGETVMVPARKMVRFKPGLEMEKRVEKVKR